MWVEDILYTPLPLEIFSSYPYPVVVRKKLPGGVGEDPRRCLSGTFFFSLLRFGIALCTWHWKCDVNSYHNATMVSCFHFRYGTRPFGPRNDFWRYTSIIIIYDLIYSIYLGYLKLGCIEDTLVGLSPLTTAIVTTAGFFSELKLHLNLVQLLGRGTTSMPEMPRKQNWLFLAHTKIRNHNILPWIKDPSQVATEGCVGNPVY